MVSPGALAPGRVRRARGDASVVYSQCGVWKDVIAHGHAEVMSVVAGGAEVNAAVNPGDERLIRGCCEAIEAAQHDGRAGEEFAGRKSLTGRITSGDLIGIGPRLVTEECGFP